MACQEFFREGGVVFVRLAMDAARIDGRDTLYSTLFGPGLLQGCWRPPPSAGLSPFVVAAPFARVA
eukprot:5663993-Lingulodinium_polyedra.AAC.1